MTILAGQRQLITADHIDQFVSGGILAAPFPHVSSGFAAWGTDVNYVGVPGNTQGTSARAIGTLWATPFLVQLTGIINRVGFNVTATAVGGVGRAGLYTSDPGNGFYPQSLLFDTGSLDCAGATGFKSAACAVAVQVGQVLWLVYQCGTLAPTITTVGGNNAFSLLGYSAANAGAWTGASVAQAFGALPATFPAGAALGSGPNAMVFVRYA